MRIIALSLMFVITLQTGIPLAYAEIVGGSCKYKSYTGKAEITSITRLEIIRSEYSHEMYEIKFSFKPDQKISEEFARMEGREYVLLLKNSSYPGPKFLEKYDLKVGKTLECNMNVITKGACTPIIFDFPSVRLDEYFEG